MARMLNHHTGYLAHGFLGSGTVEHRWVWVRCG